MAVQSSRPVALLVVFVAGLTMGILITFTILNRFNEAIAKDAAGSANLPNTPPVYAEMLGPSYYGVSMEDLHFTFSQEDRAEAWAFAVESEILQYVANSGVADWAEIEYVECRKSICEIAGYMLGDTTHDPREILDGIDESTWWHGSMSTHQMSNSSDGLDRFLVIVTALNFEGRIRPPRPVQ